MQFITGVLFHVFYNTKLTNDKLSVFIQADNAAQAKIKAMSLLAEDNIEVTSVEKVI